MVSASLTFLRLAAALFLTAFVLPFLHAYLFYVLLYVGPSPFFIVLNLIGIGVIALLVRGLQRRPRLVRWRWPLTGLIILLWTCGTALTIGPLLELRVRPLLHIAVASLASLWQPAVAWSPFYPYPWRNRLAVFVVLLSAQGLYPTIFRIDGVTGDDFFIVAWRTSAQSPEVKANFGSAKVSVQQQRFPQYLGPHRNGIIPDTRLDPDWEEHPPELIWRRPVGPGWGAFSVDRGLAITQEQRDQRESVVAYDLSTGKEAWIHQDPFSFTQSMGGPGPRATPTIAGAQIYALGATGQLNCLDLGTGTSIWSTNVLKDISAPMDDNGVTSSPLVTNGLVIVGPTGSTSVSLVAYQATTGALRWQASGAPASYSSPNMAIFDGMEQLVQLDGDGLAGHDLATGTTLWRFPFNENGNSCPQPILRPDDQNTVFVSTDRGGSALLRIDRAGDDWKATPVWTSQFMRTKFSNPVCLNGHVYGLDAGILACMRIDDGKLLWKSGRYRHGQMLLVGSYLLILSENGELALIEPSPRERRELARFAAIEGKTWNNLALAGNLLIVRNAEQAACFRLATLSDGHPSDRSESSKAENQ